MIRMGLWIALGTSMVVALPSVPALGQSRKRLSPADIRVVMNRHIPKIKKCGRAHRASGMVRMMVKITGRTGRVHSVKILGAHARKPVAYCVIRIVRWARFPRFRSATQTFVMPVNLPRGKKLPVRLSHTEVRIAIDRLQPAFDRCAKKHSAKGKARARLTIRGRTGRVSKAKLIGRFAGKRVAPCLVRALKKARFGRVSRRSMVVVWTLRLR